MLEAGLNADNAFVTLTYADDPVSLEPLHHRRFMDALRKRLAPMRVRFYMVGEYGEKNDRPHFHYALFGYPSCKGHNPKKAYRCCSACDLLEEVWGRGFVKNLPLEIGSARYIARYVVKKMTRFDDPRLKANMHPEFSRMSLKPGIGQGCLEKVAAVITRYNLLTREGDVPVTLAHGGIQWPLGRYLRKQLRKKMGLDERSPTILSPEASYDAFQENETLRALQKAAIDDPQNPSLRYHTLKASEGKRNQMEARLKIFSSKGKL